MPSTLLLTWRCWRDPTIDVCNRLCNFAVRLGSTASQHPFAIQSTAQRPAQGRGVDKDKWDCVRSVLGHAPHFDTERLVLLHHMSLDEHGAALELTMAESEIADALAQPGLGISKVPWRPGA